MKILVLAVVLAACGGDDQTTMTIEQLQDPSTCMQCHPKHFTQWQSSMHAYASNDPVFVALNKRGQRETNNQLGTFCVKCHAPMAVNLGLTDGTNFDPAALPASAKGVTCYFCHNVKEITDTHDNPLVLANDTTMRGGAKNPAKNSAHIGLYDETMDSDINDSKMCGACHDIVNGHGVALERSYAEWQTTFFTQSDPVHHLSCGGCHMRSSKDVIADDPDATVTLRDNGFHQHQWQAVDTALIDWPGQDDLKEQNQNDLDQAVTIIGPKPIGGIAGGGLCVGGPIYPNMISVRMDSVGTGHAWPSGASHDRRAWMEVIAYDASNNILDARNVVPDGMDPPDEKGSVFYDRTFTDEAKTTKAHFFWDVVAEDVQQLRAPVTLDPNSALFDHSTTYTFHPTNFASIDHVTATMKMRAFPMEMLNLLVQSGDLDPSIPGKVPTLTIAGATRTWSKATQDPQTACSAF